MLREVIHANSKTDVDAVISRLRAQAASSGLAPVIAELLLQQLGDLLRQLVEQGKRIAASGSKMEVARDLSGDGYSIRIIFREGVKKSFIQRVRDRFRGR